MKVLQKRKPSRLPSLRQVYLRTTMMVVVVSVVLLAIFIGALGMKKLTAFTQLNLQLLARSTAVTIEAAVYFDDKDIVTEQLEQLLRDADVFKARITLSGGANYLDWQDSAEQAPTGPGYYFIHWLLSPESSPILMQQQEIAVITLWPKGERIALYMLHGFIGLLLCLVLTLILLLWGTRHLHHIMSQPLLELASVSSMVRSKRDFSHRISRSGIAEIDQLRIDFNALLDELSQWQSNVEAAHTELQQHAYFDALTGVRNRNFFEQSLHRAIERALRQSGELAILYIDGDGFKAVNDTYGHAAGDEVLKALASRIQQQLRTTDLIARLGGDEFCVLIDGPESDVALQHLCQKIIAQVSQPIILSNQETVQVSISIGVACYPQHGDSAEALMQAADAAMYQVKGSGRNGYRLPLA
ncbi:diguanylate cyclase [Alkalimonas sp. MEB108]|uniref:Diguanylate cyclase n=1 Tax=Alkalimonas cellulosilytica TaxID=3058395 RepID=A0ABU7J7B8_9GAMM|nr:diguanylate cyclase [Alkalimonas sp. MEB108]MEE2002406.1 diguanylate cyclase [Alkalimonas sp. MEB108]